LLNINVGVGVGVGVVVVVCYTNSLPRAKIDFIPTALSCCVVFSFAIERSETTPTVEFDRWKKKE